MKNTFSSLITLVFLLVFETSIVLAQALPLTIQWNTITGGNSYDYGCAIAKTRDGGYVSAGVSQSSDIVKYPGTSDIWVVKVNSSGQKVWQIALGGSNSESANGDPIFNSTEGIDVAVATDGNIYVVGTTFSNDGDAIGNHGAGDILVIKLDSNGNKIKSHDFGGTSNDIGNAICIGQSGDIVIAGWSSSGDFDATGNMGNNWWVLSLNDTLGITRSKFYGSGINGGGGFAGESAGDIQPASDGGYFITGFVSELRGQVTSFHGGADAWTIKIDANGNLVWQESFGGSAWEDGRCVLPTPDGGCVVGVASQSCDYGLSNYGCGNGTYDIYLIKFDAQGNIFWQKDFGGSNEDKPGGLLLTPDNNYLSIGSTNSQDHDVSGNIGSLDYWALKVDPLGNKIYQQCIGTSGPNGDVGSSCVLANDNSYIFNGYEEDDGPPYTVISYGIVKAYETPAAPPPIVPWTATLGGTKQENANDAEPTTDNGAIVAGVAYSNDGDVTGQHGPSPGDPWIVKLDSTGKLQWEKCFGKGSLDFATSILQTNSGYIFTQGSVDGNWGITNIDPNGGVIWNKSFGSGTPNNIQKTNDKAYITAGSEFHNGGGPLDFAIKKIDSSGHLLWQKDYGGSQPDIAVSIQQTTDNGYIAAGYTGSSDGDVTGYHGGEFDAWVIKTDANGNLQWQKALGGTNIDYAECVRQTSDGGYIVACRTASNNGDVSGNHGGYDFWMVKLDASGNIVWKKTFGGTADDNAFSVRQMSNGQYIVVGGTRSNNGDVSGNHGSQDYWIIKIDGNGNLVSQNCVGGTSNDAASSVAIASDGKLIVAGSAQSNDGNVHGNHGSVDYWILKLIDENQIFYQDVDGDGYGNPSASAMGYLPPAGYIANNLDCNDANSSIHPGVLDVCNGLDDDCDGVIDEDGDYVRYLKDADGDGYGNSDSVKWLCSPQSGYVTTGSDCDDTKASVHPGACEIYFNGIDEDCNGIADDCNAPSSGFATTNITATTAKVKWNTLTCAVGYNVQYRKVGTSTWITVKVNSNTGNKKLTNLQPQTNYEWQVRTKCQAMPNAFSDYSALQNFTTSSQRNVELMSDLSTVKVIAFPNPTSNFLYIQCDNWYSDATITIYSILGEVMIQKLSAPENDSIHEAVDVSKFPAGNYIMVVRNSFEVGEIKFIKE